MTDTLGLTGFRTQLATILRDNLDDDVGVFDAIPDSIAPPSVYVTWSNPWLVAQTWCEYTAAAQLIVVSQRIEPGGQYGVLESLVAEIITILRTQRVPIRDVTSPYPITLGGVDYLACSFNILTDVGE
jgi:hypothetical protein